MGKSQDDERFREAVEILKEIRGKTVKGDSKEPRTNIRLPKALVDEIDRLVKIDPIYGNRQQFVESAIREKIEKVRQFLREPEGEDVA